MRRTMRVGASGLPAGLRLGKRAGAAVLTGLLLWAPPPTKADDDDWGGGRYWRHHEGGEHGRRHAHGGWCPPRRYAAPRYAPPPYVVWAPGWYAPPPPPPPPPPVVRARYRCDPCGRWYDDEGAFYYHVNHYHGIAEALVPMVIGAAAFGWIFYGH